MEFMTLMPGHIPMTSCPLVKTKTYDEQNSKNWQFLSPPLSTAFIFHIFTTRKQSLVQGDVFTHACHPVHRRGGGRWLPSMHHRSHAQHPRRVCLQGGLPTGSLATGGSVYRGLYPGGLPTGGLHLGGLSTGVLPTGGLHPGGSANRGVCIGGIGQTHHQNYESG